MERIGQPRFGGAGAGGHFLARTDPVAALGDIGPAADRRDPALQRVDVAAGVVELGDRLRHVIRADLALAQVLPQPRHEARVGFRAVLAEIGERGDFPQPRDVRARPHAACHIGILGETLEHRQVDRFGCGGERGMVGRGLEIADQRRQVVAARLGIAPEQPG